MGYIIRSGVVGDAYFAAVTIIAKNDLSTYVNCRRISTTNNQPTSSHVVDCRNQGNVRRPAIDIDIAGLAFSVESQHVVRAAKPQYSAVKEDRVSVKYYTCSLKALSTGYSTP